MKELIKGWCIIDSRDGSRFLGLYESGSGAKASFLNWSRKLYEDHEFYQTKFNDQSVYILKPLVQYVEAQYGLNSEIEKFVWLWTHCRALGMQNVSDSGKMEDDIALFVSQMQRKLLEKE